MPHLKNAADTLASSTGATAASPVPTPSIDPTFAPGKRGPAGVSPRQNYSRVNTGAPPQLDAGASEQKSMAPRGAEMLPKRASAGEENMAGSMAARPMLQDLVKQAMVTSGERVRVSEEARLQQEKTAEEKCASCGEDKHSGACKTKKASASAVKLGGLDVEKLASALDACAEILLKEGANLAGAHNLTEHLQTSPPGVTQATASKSLPDHKGQGVHTVPMHPSEQKALPAEHGGTQMENNLAHPVGGKMIEKNYGAKHAGVVSLIRTKLASSSHEKKETEGLDAAKKGLETAEAAHKSEPENKEAGVKAGDSAPSDLVGYLQSRIKQAEDAINPAQISAGAAVAPETSAAGESGGAPAGGAPQGPTGLVGSSESARDYTKGEAYANRKNDLKQYFQEPALSAEHDSTLRAAFENTGKAGTKFASAEGAPADKSTAGESRKIATPAAASVKTAAARVLLTKLAASIDEKQSPGTSAPAAAPGRV
jgi:hypothetical protein